MPRWGSQRWAIIKTGAERAGQHPVTLDWVNRGEETFESKTETICLVFWDVLQKESKFLCLFWSGDAKSWLLSVFEIAKKSSWSREMRSSHTKAVLSLLLSPVGGMKDLVNGCAVYWSFSSMSDAWTHLMLPSSARKREIRRSSGLIPEISLINKRIILWLS